MNKSYEANDDDVVEEASTQRQPRTCARSKGVVETCLQGNEVVEASLEESAQGQQ